MTKFLFYILLSFLFLSSNVFAKDKELYCLTKNIYYEARGETYLGQLAVAHVTLNRVREGKWGDSICKVVYSPNQFSWTRDKSLKRHKIDRDAWQESYDVATHAMFGLQLSKFSSDTLYFCNKKVKSCKRGKTTVARIGEHVFYEER